MWDNYDSGTFDILSYVTTAVFIFLIILIFIILLALMVKNKSNASPNPLKIIEERYAKGEINREEFEQKKKDILEAEKKK